MNPPPKDEEKHKKKQRRQLSCKNCGEKLLYIARNCPLCGVDLTSKEK
jgi:predicted amidophosphoribosyltransferase